MNTPELTTVRRAEKHSPVWLLSAARLMPEKPPRFGVQILYGFSEKKERWFPFMQFIAACGGAAVIHDLRGYGATAPEESSGRPAEALADFGYSRETLTDDIDAVWQACIPETPTPLPRFLFGHGMGALIAGLYAAALFLAGHAKKERFAFAPFILLAYMLCG